MFHICVGPQTIHFWAPWMKWVCEYKV